VPSDAPCRADDVAYREIDSEMVLVSASSSRIYSLTAVGGFVWQRADGSRTVASLADEVSATFEVEADQAAADVAAFVEDLRREGLFVSADAGGVPAR
jgi:hypothetical protein